MHCVRSTLEPCISMSRHVTGLGSTSVEASMVGTPSDLTAAAVPPAAPSVSEAVAAPDASAATEALAAGTAAVSAGRLGADAQPANARIPTNTRRHSMVIVNLRAGHDLEGYAGERPSSTRRARREGPPQEHHPGVSKGRPAERTEPGAIRSLGAAAQRAVRARLSS